jgi:hypothetical protein
MTRIAATTIATAIRPRLHDCLSVFTAHDANRVK